MVMHPFTRTRFGSLAALCFFFAAIGSFPAAAQRPWASFCDDGQCDSGTVPTGCDCDACTACSNDGCETCADVCISFESNVLFMQRSRPDARVLIQDVPTPALNLNANNFDFGYEPGFDAAVNFDVAGRGGLQLCFSQVDSWSEVAALNTPTANVLQINTNPMTFLVTGRAINAVYQSELMNAEINWRRWLGPQFGVLAGFRYTELDELYNVTMIDAVTPAPAVFFDTTTQNRLYGFQLGIETRMLNLGRLEIQAAGKAGIYGNAASQFTILRTGFVQLPAAGNSGRTAVMGEVNVSAALPLTDNLSLRGGYQVLWIDGVALATDQTPATNLITQTGFDDTGNVFYHGAFVGIVWTQ